MTLYAMQMHIQLCVTSPSVLCSLSHVVRGDKEGQHAMTRAQQHSTAAMQGCTKWVKSGMPLHACVTTSRL